jgi:hypothetical protein
MDGYLVFDRNQKRVKASPLREDAGRNWQKDKLVVVDPDP